jgi:uncharacterized protein (UPF0276 family)
MAEPQLSVRSARARALAHRLARRERRTVADIVERAERADALILLDVNNAIVNSKNLGGSPVEFLEGLPKARVRQLHLAGHTDHGTHAIDDHGSAVPDDVWQLYREVVRRFGPVPAIVEWDENVPTLRELEEQARLAETVEREILRDTRAA